MPPRRSARLTAAAFALDGGILLALPPVLQRAVMTRLPADAKARCACVCRAWRAALQEPSLWQDLDLSPSSGVTCRKTVEMVAAVAARASGTLRTLNVSGFCGGLHEALLAVVTANAESLHTFYLRDVKSDPYGLQAVARQN